MMGTPNSPSSERAESSESRSSGSSSTSYSGIFPLPLSNVGLGRGVFSSRGGSCGPISSVELGLSFGGGLGRVSSSELAFNSSSIGSDGVASGLYQDADSSKTTSRLIRIARVEGLKQLYALFVDKYPMRIHSSDVASDFSRLSFGMRTFAMLPNTLRCERMGFLPTRTLYGVSSCTLFVGHQFMR